MWYVRKRFINIFYTMASRKGINAMMELVIEILFKIKEKKDAQFLEKLFYIKNHYIRIFTLFSLIKY